MSIRRALLTILAVSCLSAAAAAPAAAARSTVPQPVKTYTITVQWDSNIPPSWSRRAPEVWKDGTHLNFARGTCAGARCIQVHTDALGTPCSPGNGCSGDWGATYPDLHVVTCHVWLPNQVAATQSRDVQWSMAAHEVGHCLGLGHSSDPYSIMWPETQIYQPTMYPNAGDVANVNALWP